MAALIGVLCEEHRNIEKLLEVLDRELVVFDRGERPDYDMLEVVAGYFQDYPSLCHHPKEDAIFALLKTRDPSAAEAIAAIEAEHRGEAERLRRFALVIESVRLDHEVRRQTLHDAIRGFVDYQRQHIAKEEQGLFPAAARSLTPEDWAALSGRPEGRKDPLFEGGVEERFRVLRQRLLQWEAENEADRAGTSAHV